MNKITFTWILQCALLSYDNMTKEEMIEIGADEREVIAGIKLYQYLDSIEVKQ